MRTVEKPAADDEFNNPRKAGNYNTATAALGPLEAAGVIRLGNFNSAYVTSWDGEGYSVEFAVDGLPDIVIHVHCTKEGHPKGAERLPLEAEERQVHARRQPSDPARPA